MGLNILHEDDRLLVVDKPAGLTVEALAQELGYFPAHRLDKDTSGILLCAKDAQTLERLHSQFKERKVEKKYVCLVQGNIKQEGGTLHTLLGRSKADRRKQRAYPLQAAGIGKREAITEWKILKRFENYTLLEVTLKTGRKHQIRAHMASIGHPITGDKLYGFKNQQIPSDLKRQFLHASYLKIGNAEFSSELPEDLQKVLEKLPPKNDSDH